MFARLLEEHYVNPMLRIPPCILPIEQPYHQERGVLRRAKEERHNEYQLVTRDHEETRTET
jgi:hypothetical protein